MDLILNNEALELWVIPGNVSSNLVFKRHETQEKLSHYKNKVSKNLSNRWKAVNAGDTWIMWDLALVEVIVNPDLAKSKKVMTPPENTQRKINMYTWIDADRIEAKFWESYKRLMDKLN